MALLNMMQSPLAQLALLAQQQGQQGPQGPIRQPGPTMPQGVSPVPQMQFQQPDESKMTTTLPQTGMAKAQPSRFQRFQTGLLNAIAPQPGEAAQSLLGADAIRSAQRQALLSLSANLLQAGGASARPINIGEALGRGLSAAQETYGGAINSGINQALTAESRAALADQRGAMADNARAQQQQRQFDLQNQQRIMALGPKYQQIFAKLPMATTPEARKAVFLEAYGLAQAEGDEDRMKSIQAMFAAGGTAFTDGAANAGYAYERMGDGTLVAINKQNPNDRLTIGGPKPQDVGGGGGSGDGGPPKGVITSTFSMVQKDAKKFAESGANLRYLEQRINSGLPQTGTDQYNLLFKFVQSRDNSVVRASELDLLKSADPLLNRLAQFFAGGKITRGQLVSPQIARQIVQVMRQEFDARIGAERGQAQKNIEFLSTAPGLEKYDWSEIRKNYGIGATPAASTNGNVSPTTAPQQGAPPPAGKRFTYRP